MAAVAIFQDIMWSWYSVNCIYWTKIEPTFQGKGINLEAILCLLLVLAITICACFGMVVVWFPSAGALQYLYEALINEKEDDCKPNWKE